MDTFIDKLAQKRNAQEMIRANMTAEAAKMEQLQNQLQAYDGLMQEIRQVNLRTAENVSEVRNVLQECIGKLEAMQETEGQTADHTQMLQEIKNLLEQKFQLTEDFMHKENVRVYRNVQASFVEELHKQTEELRSSQPKNSAGKILIPVSILTLLGVIADVVLQVLQMLNFKLF